MYAETYNPHGLPYSAHFFRHSDFSAIQFNAEEYPPELWLSAALRMRHTAESALESLAL